MKRIDFRCMALDDWPAIQQLHRDQQAAQQTDYELPLLWGPSIAVALVGVDNTGKIHNCIYVELVGELRFVGCDPKATAFGQRQVTSVSYLLKQRGIRWLETYIPRQLKQMIEKPLRRAGFTCVDDELSHFTRDLR